jgi:hypothetical protein
VELQKIKDAEASLEKALTITMALSYMLLIIVTLFALYLKSKIKATGGHQSEK